MAYMPRVIQEIGRLNELLALDPKLSAANCSLEACSTSTSS